VQGYICLTELLTLDEVHLHKNNGYYPFCVPLCFIYFMIKSEGFAAANPLLVHMTRWPLFFSHPQHSLSQRLHLGQWPSSKKLLHWANVGFRDHGYFKTEL